MFKKLLATTTSLAVGLLPYSSFAAPQGGVVTEGQATISTPDNTTTSIHQTTQNATINWQSFNVNANELVRFEQPNSQSVTLNKINDVNASQILGQIQANGQIFLINPNGIVFGEGSRIDVGGLVATTSNLDSFDNTSTFQFSGSGLDAKIVNNGTITAADSGLVALVAPTVQNNGTITARLGKITLQGGENFTLDLYGDQLITLSTENNPTLAKSIVENSGTLSANGGVIALSAAQASNALNNVVNMTGYAEANTVNTQNGRIILGTDGGHTQFSGTAVADSGIIRIGGGWQGGEDLASSTYTTASGYIDVSGKGSADAGSAVVWADNTTAFTGTILAQGGESGGNGGQVEVSGKNTLGFKGTVTTTASHGETGNLLLDPLNITITDGASGADDAELANATILATDSPAGNFVISEQALEAIAAGTNISLEATENITINDLTDDVLNLQTTGNVAFLADSDSNGSGDFTMDASDEIATAGANIDITGVNIIAANLNSSAGSTGHIALDATTGGTITLLGDLTTDGGNVQFNEDVILGDHITISTGLGSGNAIFNQTLTGVYTAAFALGGAGNLTLGGDVDVTGLSFSSGNAITLGGNITTDNALSFAGLSGITLTANTNIIADNGIVKNDITFGGGNIVNGAYNLTLTGGTVSVHDMGNSSPLTSLTITADTAVLLNGNITTTGTQNYSGDVTLSGDLQSVNSSISIANALTLTNNSSINTDTGLGDITVGGVINGTTTGTESLIINAGTGDVLLASAIGQSTLLQNLSVSGNTITTNNVATDANQTYAGTTYIEGTYSNITGDITFNSPVILTNDTTLDTSTGSGNVTFVDTLDGAYNLTATTGSGQVALQGITGGNTALNQLSLTGNGLALNTIYTTNAQSFSGALTLNGDLTTSTGALTLLGNVTLNSDSVLTSGGTVSDHITITGALAGDHTLELIAGLGDLNLNGIDVDTLTLTSGTQLNAGGNIIADTALDFTNLGNINITTAANIEAHDGTTAADIILDSANTIAGSGALTLRGRNISLYNVSGISDLTVSAEDGGVLTLNNPITTTGFQDYSGTTHLYGNLTTTNANITFNDDLTLYTNTTLSSSNGNISLIGQTNGAYDLILNAGTGDILTQGVVGGITPIANLTATGTNVTFGDLTTTGNLIVVGDTTINGLATVDNDIDITGSITLNGTGLTSNNSIININGDIDLTADTQLQTGLGSGDDLTISGNITGDYDLTLISGSGNLTLNGSADINALNLTSGYDLYLNGGTYITDNTLDFTNVNTIYLGGDTTLTASDGTTRANITLAANNPILGAHHLSFTGDQITLYDIGDGTAANDPLSLTVDGSSVYLMGAVSTDGTQTYTSLNGLAGNLTTNGADITISSALNLLDNITISTGAAGGDITINDTVDGNYSLALNAGTGTITTNSIFGGTTPLNDVTLTGSALNIYDILTTTGNQTYNGPTTLQGGLITAGGDITFNDILNLSGSTLLTTGATTAGDIIFNYAVNDTNDITLSAGLGDILFNGAAGSTNRLGHVTVLTAHNVTFSDGAYVTQYTQNAGTGDVTFGNTPGLDATGDITISGAGNIIGTFVGEDILFNPTGKTTATVTAESLTIGGNSSQLQGIIAGTSGRDAARLVKYIAFKGGPHYMNGYTLPLIGDFAAPATFVTTALSNRATPSQVTLDFTNATQYSMNPFTTAFTLVHQPENFDITNAQTNDIYKPFWQYYLEDDTILTLN